MARSLEEIAVDILQHCNDNPHHGSNCSCMDRYVRELRQQIDSALPQKQYSSSYQAWDDPIWVARRSLTHVLITATRDL